MHAILWRGNQMEYSPFEDYKGYASLTVDEVTWCPSLQCTGMETESFS